MRYGGTLSHRLEFIDMILQPNHATFMNWGQMAASSANSLSWVQGKNMRPWTCIGIKKTKKPLPNNGPGLPAIRGPRKGKLRTNLTLVFFAENSCTRIQACAIVLVNPTLLAFFYAKQWPRRPAWNNNKMINFTGLSWSKQTRFKTESLLLNISMITPMSS